MVGIMAVNFSERTGDLLKSARFSAETPAKLKLLRPLKELVAQMDGAMLSDVVPLLIEFQHESSSPVRKLVGELIGEIGLKHVEFVPDMVPSLMAFLKDAIPAVARQAIITGTYLFRHIFKNVAIQGLFSSELDKSLESSWAWLLKFKEAILPLAFESGSDGVRLLAIRFVEAIILLYTPDPNGPPQPSCVQDYDEAVGFDISWFRGGHPMLKVSELAVEASQSLALLLDQLRFPSVKSVSNSIIIVLINSVAAIAKERPAYYGRILPVLLNLDASSAVVKGVQVAGAYHALKNAFMSCLECTHPGAAPWRERLLNALKAIEDGNLVEHEVLQVDQVSESATEMHPIKEEKLVIQASDAAEIDSQRKRSLVQEFSDQVKDDDLPESSGKRVKTAPLEGPNKELLEASAGSAEEGLPSAGPTVSMRDTDIGPVQQLVAMFGALVAQGERAATSLEILISSISSDLLAEVVMANMRFLPQTCPKLENEEELNSASTSSSQPSFISDILSLLNPRPLLTHGTLKDGKDEPMITTAVDTAELSAPSSSLVVQGLEQGPLDITSGTIAIEDGQIPGLDSRVFTFENQDTLEISHSSTSEGQGSQDQSASLGVYTSDTNSPKLAATESTSVSISSQFLLPKMSAPVVHISDEEKDNIQKLAFVRILEAYKQIAVAGGSDIRFSLLAYLGAEYPLELDSWGFLQKHIMADYLNHEGHELTLRVLYRLYRDAEQDQDFFSSTTATSIYESFLLAVAEMLRDSFPASDKSLSRLLGEVPYLPKSVFKLLECLCSPKSGEKGSKEPLSGDRVTQGLSAVWNLILSRPPIRDTCLKIALQSAVHQLEEVRMKAIRLVANKLYSMVCISQKIEDFANEILLSVVHNSRILEGSSAEESIIPIQKEHHVEKHASAGPTSAAVPVKELVSDAANPLVSASSMSSSAISEAQRCMSLYFALCTKAMHRHIPILVRTIGSSAELLHIISDPPDGSESLLMQVLHTLTEGTIPSQELVFAVRKLYDSKLKDVEILIPILTSMTKDELLPIFPQLVHLPPDKFQAAVARLLQGSPHTSSSFTPAELLIALHGIDPDRDGIPLKKVMDALSACFEQRQVFTQQVFAKALNQLVEQIPLPLLFMRTVIQAIGVFPALGDFIMEILSRLVSKQIWKYPKLWVGFLKCALQTKPQSFTVLLQLPAAQLENALNRNPPLRSPLVTYANQTNIRSTLPRSTLVVLGLAQESQSHTQTSQSQTADPSNSSEPSTEIAPESSAVS